MSAETIVRRALRNAGQPEHFIDQYTPNVLRIFNNYVADGHSPEKAEQLLMEALRVGNEEVLREAHRRVCEEQSRALTEAVVKRTFMEVAESERRSRPAGMVFGSTDDHMDFLVGALAARLGESDGESLAATAEQVKRTGARLKELRNILKNPDRSGALAVLEILDRTDAARGSSEVPPGQRDASESGTSGWRHATVEDYGVAMRAALEELAESDRREIEGFRKEHDKLATELERGENGVVSLRSWGAICGS